MFFSIECHKQYGVESVTRVDGGDVAGYFQQHGQPRPIIIDSCWQSIKQCV